MYVGWGWRGESKVVIPGEAMWWGRRERKKGGIKRNVQVTQNIIYSLKDREN
jgi:LDH2 family malate/lactate/ureidoglycolate dehydrogenase